MMIEQLISPEVPTLMPTDTGNKALLLMEENNLTQLPLVKEEQYVGLVQENELLDWARPETQFDKAEHQLSYRPAILASGHPYDALRIAHQQNLAIVPVIDNENKYLGAITRDDLLKYITENSGWDNPGGIIVLEMDPRNYSLTDIARICENEETIVLSSQIFSNRGTGKLEVTLKTNRTNLGVLVASFERHEYKVKEVYGEQANQEDMMDRLKSLMNYINM
jgi:acetoin utilization protein AcuB